MKIEFQYIPQEVYRVGKLHAKAKAEFEMLSESKKSVLATEASKHEWSEATKERLARSSDIYRNYLVSVANARQKELEYKYELDSLTMWFEYMRSLNSLKKAEMNIT